MQSIPTPRTSPEAGPAHRSIEHLTPVEVAQRMDEIQNRIAKGIIVVDQLFGEWQDAELAFDLAEARAYVADAGPAHEKKFRARLATEDERQAMNVALRKLKRAQMQLRHLESDLSRWQSTNRNVMQAYSAVGVVAG